MTGDKRLFDFKAAYVQSDNLWDFVQSHFPDFQRWLAFEEENKEAIDKWEEERLFRILECTTSGLVTQAMKGNAAAVTHLRSILGMSRPVGRPKGTRNLSPEYQEAIQRRILDEYEQDAVRLADLKN
ncbi:hypothetical protein [uncultured Roseibium sp.]|uniref:hypothetical protein n=1 Tax=uncultured Roseibium sp. TaxID=1936171 RepID=UPI003216BC95